MLYSSSKPTDVPDLTTAVYSSCSECEGNKVTENCAVSLTQSAGEANVGREAIPRGAQGRADGAPPHGLGGVHLRWCSINISQEVVFVEKFSILSVKSLLLR